MTAGWGGPRHRTAQQRRAARTPVQRKVDKASRAPAVKVPPVVCGRDGCGCPRLVHNPECNRCGTCPSYVEAQAAP